MKIPGQIGERELSDLFHSKDFERLLRKSALHTFKNGYECGFFVERDLQDRFLYSGIIAGNTYSIDHEQRNVALRDLEEESGVEPGKSYPVFDLHFHPDVNGYVCPSGPEDNDDDYYDMGGLNSLREHEWVNCKPICGVAQIDFDRNIDMLLLQETPKRPITMGLLVESYSMINELKDRGYPSTQDIAQEFRKTGLYKATNIEFRLTSNGVLIPESESDKLKDFAYQPSLKDVFDEESNRYISNQDIAQEFRKMGL